MSSRQTKKPNQIIEDIKNFVEENIIEQNLEEIFGERFGRYSKYIIQDRALPDARDGLKPVQRRILFAMYKLGMFSNKPYKKSARIVGEVIGKYHPHGDTSVYDAMVRMAQDWKMCLPLIDMHGNKGSVDGDPAAAMRYTEARLSVFAECLLQDINKKTVGFIPNFDDEELEPTVLPAKFPNLLANGSTGISAGYATNIPPHNISELIASVIYRIDKPKCKISEIMHIMKGPDFPTGGIIQGRDQIIKAYETGHGKIVIKSKIEIEELENKNKRLNITEIPYEVNKSQLVRRMSDVVMQKNVDGILGIRDESDRSGLRIVVDLKKSANPETIRDFFLKSTDLQINYSFNMVAIDEKRPKLMSLLEMIDSYIAHQTEVMTNRCNFDLRSAKKREHIVEGLIAMVSILDAVIQTIRSSKNKKEAIENLVSTYSFTEIQAEAIVMLQLYRLTNTDIVALKEEQRELKEKIEQLEAILSDQNLLFATIKKELMETLKLINTPRKTLIEAEIDDINVGDEDLIPKEDVLVILTNTGYLKRIPKKVWSLEDNETTKLKENDFVVGVFETTTVETMLLFTNIGNYIYLPVHKIPEVKHKDHGYHISTLVNIEANESVMFSTFVSDFKEEKYLMFTTKQGLIKLTPLKDYEAQRYSKALKATKLNDGDQLVSVALCSSLDGEAIVVSKNGFLNRYDLKEISIMAPNSCGVRAMELRNRPDDSIVAGYPVEDGDILVVLTERNAVKRFKNHDILKNKRNSSGKQYLTLMKNIPSAIIDHQFIKKQNANIKLVCYGIGDKGIVKIPYETIRDAQAASGSKITGLTKSGDLKNIIVVKNNADVY